MTVAPHEVTQLLIDWSSGNQAALDKLMPLVYEELHAAQLVRRILVDYARKRKNAKRGGGARQVPLDEAMIVLHQQAADVLALDDALKSLAVIDSRQSQIVELRFFGGLTIEETAEVLKVSPGTVMQEWTFAKAWLQREIKMKDEDGR